MPRSSPAFGTGLGPSIHDASPRGHPLRQPDSRSRGSLAGRSNGISIWGRYSLHATPATYRGVGSKIHRDFSEAALSRKHRRRATRDQSGQSGSSEQSANLPARLTLRITKDGDLILNGQTVSPLQLSIQAGKWLNARRKPNGDLRSAPTPTPHRPIPSRCLASCRDGHQCVDQS